MDHEHPQLDQPSVHITKAPKRDKKSESMCEGIMREMFQTWPSLTDSQIVIK